MVGTRSSRRQALWQRGQQVVQRLVKRDAERPGSRRQRLRLGAGRRAWTADHRAGARLPSSTDHPRAVHRRIQGGRESAPVRRARPRARRGADAMTQAPAAPTSRSQAIGICPCCGEILRACARCRLLLRADSFDRCSARADKLQPWCRACRNALRRERTAKRAKRRAAAARWRAANPGKQAEYSRRWRAAHPEHSRRNRAKQQGLAT